MVQTQTQRKKRRPKRSEEERINFFRTDPYVAQFEAYRVLCAGCDKWIRLRSNSSYCSIPWEAHRKSCLAKKGWVSRCSKIVFPLTSFSVVKNQSSRSKQTADCARTVKAGLFSIGMIGKPISSGLNTNSSALGPPLPRAISLQRGTRPTAPRMYHSHLLTRFFSGTDVKPQL